MSTRHSRVACLCLGLTLLAAAGCARGADEARLQADLQTRLNREVKPDLFEVVGLRREGSAPMPASESGAARVIVYYNATLKLAQDYSFGSWDQLAPSSVALVLGATDKGVLGLEPQNKAGDLVRAYGSAVYEQTADGWTATTTVPAQTAAAPNIDGTAPPSQSKQMIDKLAALVELPPPGVPPQDDSIIAEELARASENIERRVQRREHVFTVATGPENGEYARFGAALIAAVNELAPAVKLRQRHSEGSVENALLLARGEADYAIVQGDVAAAAVAGEDAFAEGGPLAGLRAVGGLFPEAIHIVVPRDSPIREVSELRGRRVDIGAPTSGTQFDAVAVLAAYGLTRADSKESREEGLTSAIVRLKRKQLDALFVTIAAPTRPLQELALEPGLRLLPLTDAAVERLVQNRQGLVRLTLPANTYPRQDAPLVTVASSALLLTTAAAPVAEVERVTDLVFIRMPQKRAGSADVVKVSALNELRGVTIPLHPGAARRGGADHRPPLNKELVMSRVAAVMSLATLVLLAARVDAQVKVIRGERQTTSATVEAVDVAGRRITIRNPRGEIRTIRVPEQVTGLAEIQRGETVTAVYYENIVLRLKAPGEPDADNESTALTPGQGPSPVGTSGTQQTISATITAIDLKAPSIAFKGPRGWSYETKVRDRDALKQVNVGDRVDIVWTEATLVSVRPAKK